MAQRLCPSFCKQEGTTGRVSLYERRLSLRRTMVLLRLRCSDARSAARCGQMSQVRTQYWEVPATPDGSWTAFTSVSSSGGGLAGTSRYLQYESDLSSSDPSQTPVLEDGVRCRRTRQLVHTVLDRDQYHQHGVKPQLSHGQHNACGTLPWNPTLAQRTRKDGAPAFCTRLLIESGISQKPRNLAHGHRPSRETSLRSLVTA